MALYLASKIDPHYLVRDAANDALGVLIVCRRACYTEVFAAADALAKQLKGKYRPGGPDCAILFDACVRALPGTLVPGPTPKPEHIPAPMPKGAAMMHIDESFLPRVARTTAPGS